MTSTVVCGYSGAAWEVNSAGQDACVQYAHLVGTCQSTFSVAPVTPASPPYLPAAGNTACSCNVVAYNLAAACGWCQDAIQADWWATQTEWSGNCTLLSATYDATGVPASVPTASLTIPAWALATVNALDNTWNPSTASLLASPNPLTATGTGLGFTTAFPTTYGYTYPGTTYNPYTYDPYGYYGAVAAYSAGTVAIGVGVAVGLWAFHFIIIGLVFWLRQKRRKAWYGPTAAFYASGGAAGPGLAAAPLLYHNEPNIPGSPHQSSTLPSHSPAPSGGYAPYQPPPPQAPQGGGPPGSTPYTPYQAYSDPRQSYQPPPGSAAGYSSHSGGGDAHAYPPGTNPFNTPYPTPGAQGPPPGAAPSGGYTGHAEVY